MPRLAAVLVTLVVVGPWAGVAGASPPAWVRPASKAWQSAFDDAQLRAIGQRAALAEVEITTKPRKVVLLGFGVDTGLLGPITQPAKASWYGLGSGDVVLAATPDGTLWRADGLVAAAAGRFTSMARVSGAKAWDVAGDRVISTNGREVWLSRDGGKTFAAVGSFKRPIEGVFVRSDGTLVADPKGAPPEVSRDHGATWMAASAEVGDLALRRIGEWIGEPLGTRACPRGKACVAACSQGVLGVNGQAWWAWDPYLEVSGKKSLLATYRHQPREVSAWEQPFERWRNAALEDVGFDVREAPPADGIAATAAVARCRQEGGTHSFRTGGLLGGLGRLRALPCHGVDCVASAPPAGTPNTSLAFVHYHDGDEAAERPRAIGIVDTKARTLRLARPPAHCAVDTIHDLGGAALLACEPVAGKPQQVLLLDELGAFHPYAVATPVSWVSRTGHGAILLGSDCYASPETCAVFFKAPGPLDDGQFTRIAVPGLRAIRESDGGQLIAVSALDPDAKAVAFHRGLPKDRADAAVACYAALDGAPLGEAELQTVLKTDKTPAPPRLSVSDSRIRSCAERAFSGLSAPPLAGPTLWFRRPTQRLTVDLLDPAGRPVEQSRVTASFEGNLRDVAVRRGRVSLWTCPRAYQGDKPPVAQRFEVGRDGALQPARIDKGEDRPCWGISERRP